MSDVDKYMWAFNHDKRIKQIFETREVKLSWLEKVKRFIAKFLKK